MIVILSLVIVGLITYIVIDKFKKKPMKVELSKEDKEKLEERKKSFNSLMNYDYEIALGSDKR